LRFKVEFVEFNKRENRVDSVTAVVGDVIALGYVAKKGSTNRRSIREEIMRAVAGVFTIALVLGATIFIPQATTHAQSAREEGPREIEKCQTISQPGSYKLVNDLTTTGDCLLIAADFVTVDLAGFSISGGANFGGMGIQAVEPPSGQRHGISVRNGSLFHFHTAVSLSGEDGSLVEGLRISQILFGGIFATGIVRGNTVTNVTNGIGIAATGSVTGNYVSFNSTGIFVDSTPVFGIKQGSTVIGNTVTNNTQAGLVVDCPSNVTDNTAVFNAAGFNLVLNGDGCNNTNNVAP
jgi:hypothetical protein